MADITSSEVINTGYAVLALVADALVLAGGNRLHLLAHITVQPANGGGACATE